MKRLLFILSLAIGLTLAGCGPDDSGHSHGDEAGHTHGEESHEQESTGSDQEHSHSESESESDSHSHSDTNSEGEQHQHEPEEPDTTGSGGDENQDHGHSHEDTTSGDDSGHGHSHDGSESHDDHSHPGKEQAAVVSGEGSGAVTHWTDETELFMEYPEIVAGQQATFAVHLTRLSDFAPLKNSTVTFAFRSPEGSSLSVTEKQVQTPGIYGPDVTFDHAGRYHLTITISGMVNDTIQVKGIPVYSSTGDIPQTHAEEHPDHITFLKEQQWKIPFGTRQVTRKTLSQTVKASGEIMAAPNQEAVVSAPFAGIVLSSQNRNLPVEGQSFGKGTSLAVLNPAIQSGGGGNYVRQFIDAQSELELAKAELRRSKSLYERDAIPKTELQKNRIAYRQAVTHYETINEVVQIDTSAIEGYGSSPGSYRFQLKAPLAGTVIESHITPGMQVEAGQPLFRIANVSRVWLKAHVPAARHHRIADAGEAAFRVQGDDRVYHLNELDGTLISKSSSVDPGSRTLSYTYELDNTPEGLPLGMFASVHIATETRKEVPAVPKSALIEEEGNFSVYVHVAGESFEKRRVTTGIRNTEWVEITSGLQPGEHVVTRNAYRVKLASLSSEAPSHGHTH